jgi:tight adherence protein C
LIFLVASTVFLATILGVLAVYFWMENRKESLPQRFKEIASPPETRSGILEGIAGKWLEGIRKRFAAKLPRDEEIVEILTGKELVGARLLLNQAGYRKPVAYTIYWSLRVGLPILLAVSAFLYGKVRGLANQPILFLMILGVAVGFVIPGLLLQLKIRKRKEQITDSLPDALDLLVVCVEAGLGLNAAFVKITEEFKLSGPVLSEEFDIVNREMVAGKPRQDALRALAERTAVEEVKSLVAMLVQTEKLGTSLAQSLRVHSDSLRTRRRQKAEEAAAKTTIKLVFPLVFLLFPALFIVILGPGVLQIIQVLLPISQR